MKLGAFCVASAVAFAASPGQAAERASKDEAPIAKLPMQRKAAASKVPAASGESKDAQQPAPTFVIPRDTCQQGEPLQTLTFGKP